MSSYLNFTNKQNNTYFFINNVLLYHYRSFYSTKGVFVLWQQYLSCVTNINIIHIFCIRLSLAEMTFDTNTIIKLG